MIVTALVVDTKRCIPSVFTMSGSSTPWTWTFVPVYDGLDAVGVATVVPACVTVSTAFAVMVEAKVSVTVPMASGKPPKNPPFLLYCWALFALAEMKLWSAA